jgi:hypothetical protein
MLLRKAAWPLSAKRLLRVPLEHARAVQCTAPFWNRLWDGKLIAVRGASKLQDRLGSCPKDVWLQFPSVQVE